jgi:trimeric autotransporter adhesin
MRNVAIFNVWKNFLFGLWFLSILLFTLSFTSIAQDQNSSLNKPQGLTTDKLGDLLIADTGNNRILRLDSVGKVAIVAGIGTANFGGDGEPAVNAALNAPKGLLIDAIGNLYIADSGNHRVRKIDAATKIITTVAGTGEGGFSGDGGTATRAQLYEPSSIALDKAGNLHIADTGNDRIRRVDSATGIISTVAGNGKSGALNDTKIGDLLKFALGNPLGDGNKATKAILSSPIDIIFDGANNLFIADEGHSRIRKVDAKSKRIKKVILTGNYVSKLSETNQKNQAAGSPTAFVIDNKGNIFIASSSDQIQRVDWKSKKVIVIAKGFNNPSDIIFDGKGNLLVADTENNRIQRINLTDNSVSTIIEK